MLVSRAYKIWIAFNNRIYKWKEIVVSTSRRTYRQYLERTFSHPVVLHLRLLGGCTSRLSCQGRQTSRKSFDQTCINRERFNNLETPSLNKHIVSKINPKYLMLVLQSNLVFVGSSKFMLGLVLKHWSHAPHLATFLPICGGLAQSDSSSHPSLMNGPPCLLPQHYC